MMQPGNSNTMRRTTLCCYLQADTAARAVAVIDIFFGAIGFTLGVVYAVNIVHDFHESQLYLAANPHVAVSRHDINKNHEWEKAWISCIFTICSGFEWILGIALYNAVSTKCPVTVSVWMAVTLITCLFTPLSVFRLYLLCVVWQFFVHIWRDPHYQARLMMLEEEDLPPPYHVAIDMPTVPKY